MATVQQIIQLKNQKRNSYKIKFSLLTRASLLVSHSLVESTIEVCFFNLGSNENLLSMPKIGGNLHLLSQFGMTPISHPDSSITLHSNNIVELQFQIRKMVDFTFDLIYHHTLSDLQSSRVPGKSLNQRLNASDYVTIKPNGGFNVIFALNLPQQGVYTFTIYASTTNESNPSHVTPPGHTELPAVFTYLIRFV